MKKLFTVLSVVLLTTMIWAQSPQKMSYQAVVRDLSNNLIKEQPVGMKISILQGSVSGTPVYVEIYNPNPNTNANGLVTIEIGGGIPITGTFASINWSNAPYFLKSEIDPTGGTNYTIAGVSQLLSVPYALHAKTAETITGTITETDPVYTSLFDATGSATGDLLKFNGTKYVKFTPDYLTGVDGSETIITAGTNVNVTGSGTAASPYVVNATGAIPLAIGQNYQGGIIFWLDATGQHGLIAATADQSTEIQWYNGTYTTINAVRDGIGAGAYNTERIIAIQGAGSYAAQLCANYQGGGYGDWYLPSKYELNLLYLQKTAVGGFAIAYYWSSSENVDIYSWALSFEDGNYTDVSTNSQLHVRAIRAF